MLEVVPEMGVGPLWGAQQAVPGGQRCPGTILSHRCFWLQAPAQCLGQACAGGWAARSASECFLLSASPLKYSTSFTHSSVRIHP